MKKMFLFTVLIGFTMAAIYANTRSNPPHNQSKKDITLDTTNITAPDSQSDTLGGKAGTKRHRGKRPKVRGVAMNPVDHRHGGGHQVPPWGQPAKGHKTRKSKGASTSW